MTDLNNAVVLITGAAGGFGRHMIRQFLAAGSQLILHDMSAEPLARAHAEVANDSDQVLASIAADLSDATGCRSLFDAVSESGLSPDILINNAGIGVGGRLDLVPGNRWEQVIQVDLLSPMRLCAMFLPAMIERRSGHIVNIASIAGWVGPKGLTSYAASKFGLRGFGESLSGDVEEFGICVSTVYPWFSNTPILDSEQFGPEDRLKIPDDVLTDPADVVEEIIAGVRANKPHIFPDKMARRIQFMKRYFPGLLSMSLRRMEKKMRGNIQNLEQGAS